MTYKPFYIAGYETGLIKERVPFTLPKDAFTELNNAYVFRERVLKKRGSRYLDRVKRRFTEVTLGSSDADEWNFNIFTNQSITDARRELEVGSLTITINSVDFVDDGRGNLDASPSGNSGTVNYRNGDISITHTQGSSAATATFNYFPGRPIMANATRELDAINNEQTIIFDTKYAYSYGSSHKFTEFISGTTWSGSDLNYFYTTNYFRDGSQRNVMWASNFKLTPSASRDPLRWTNGSGWEDFSPPLDGAGTPQKLFNARAFIPFRGRFVMFNTLEGTAIDSAVQFPGRIRWSALGTPFYEAGSFNSGNFNADAWRDDIEGQGDFLDVDVNQHIIGIGWVRDNIIIFCERSTFQLRYTNIASQPFVLERVNTELGIDSPFSMVQFDMSVMGIGDKAIIDCDGYKAEKVDLKIPDFAWKLKTTNGGQRRVHGIRDFRNRLAYWIYPDAGEGQENLRFPNKRLVYNYENNSWAKFDDQFTALGTFYKKESLTWREATFPWRDANFPWSYRTEEEPLLIGGNGQGVISRLNELSTNQKSLVIHDINSSTDFGIRIKSHRHNLPKGTVISITDIPLGTPFANLLNNPRSGPITDITQADPAVVTSNSHELETGDEVTFRDIEGMTELNGFTSPITVIDANSFSLDDIDSTNFTAYTSGGRWDKEGSNKFMIAPALDDSGDLISFEDTFTLLQFNEESGVFDIQVAPSDDDYIGGGRFAIIDNFEIKTRKFGYMDQGKGTQIGYVDLLIDADGVGEIAFRILMNYDNSPVNTAPNNLKPDFEPDFFFNVELPQNHDATSGDLDSTKVWQRIICPVQGAFLQLSYTYSDRQMAGPESEGSFSISAQVLYMRAAGTNYTNF